MTSSAQLNTVVEAVNVTVELYGRPIRAVITREAFEHRWALAGTKPDAMLASFEKNRRSIESTIIDQYMRERKEPVVVHSAG
jgi:hypothetical protein